jgi:hypothetical protein
MSALIDPPKEITILMDPPRVFVGDDNRDFLDSAEDYFSSCDFDVNAADNPEDARRILEENKSQEKGDFHVAAIDVNYGDPLEIKGDDFVRKYQHLLGRARVVLFSGEISKEERRRLEDEGFLVLDKTRTLLEDLALIVKEESRKRAGDIEKVLVDEAAPRIKELTGVKVTTQLNPLSKLAFNSLKQTLIKWLQSRKEPDKPVLAYGRRVYSANEMAAEVENETEAGVKHVLMMLREYEHSLRIGGDDSQRHDDADEE